MTAPGRRSAHPSHRRVINLFHASLGRFATWIALPLLLVAGNARGQCTGCNTTGVWTVPGPLQGRSDWGYQQVHLALLRGRSVGGVNYHSYLISWELTGGGTTRNGLYGWKPGDPGYNAYPADDHLKFLHRLGPPDIADPGVNLFCAGHSTLADGRLLVSGGHVGHDVGIVGARIFDPVTRAWQTPPDTMAYARWYPTNSTLPSGQVLTTSGSRFFRSLTFGGSTDLANPSPSTLKDEMRPGQLSYPDIVWEGPASVTPPADPDGWPDPREGHSAAWLGHYNRMIVFGGRGTNGAYRRDTWSLEYGQSPSGSYVISGEQAQDGPDFLYGHVATADYDGTFMLIHGGKNQAGAVKDQIYSFDPASAPAWSNALDQQGETQSDNLPGKRWGHAATWDDQNKRMIVFGGRGETGLANAKVYTVKVNGTVATWKEITPSGGPSAREGHTLVWDSVRRERNGGEWDRAIVFGGQDAAGVRKKDAWILWWSKDTPNVMEWQAVPDAPAGLLARTRHTSFWDLGGERFVVFGGDTGGTSSAGDVWELRVTANGALEWGEGRTHTPGLAGHTIVRTHSEIAAQPELFDPQTGEYSEAFQPRTQPAYPPMFVLPNGNLLWPASTTWTQILNPSTGAWSNIQPVNGGDDDFQAEAAVMYRPGKVMKAGGVDYDPVHGPPDPVVNPTATLTFEGGVTEGWKTGELLSGPKRHHHNLTILPNGKVLLTGGGSLKPELWDPDALPNDWWVGNLDENPLERDYHATVLVLPDARVLTAGGRDPRVTIFSPPYLFDANGNWAPRPAILDAPCSVPYGSSNKFEVRTSDIAGMQNGGKVALLRPSSVTHAFDMDQRYVPLNFSVCGDRLQIDAPADNRIAPPGEYLLFLVNGSGVPSVASWLRVGGAPLANCDAAIPSQANAPVPEIISETEIWFYWGGAADDAPSTGTVTAYDVRRSGQTIGSEAAFCTAVVADGQAVPATPLEPPGGYQYWQVTNLTPNTLYHLAMKARDESWNWGPVSASISATTLPSCCGGGGGYSARRVGDDDMLHARAEDGDSRDGVTLADATSTDRSIAGQAGGTDTQSADPMSLVSRTDEPLAVEMRLESGRPVWTIHYIDAAAAEGLAGTDGATVILQEPGADGTWQTRARLQPGAGSSRFGLRSAERTRRYIFLRPVGLDLAAQAVEAAGGGVWKLADARHSQLGDVTPAVRAAGGYDLGLLSDETLTLTYEAGTAGGSESVGDCFVFVSPSGTSAGLANRGRIRPAEAAKLPTSFALHQNQPNPFARTTTIRFDLAAESEVRLALFDAQGRLVRTLAAGRQPAGFHTVEWDRRDDAGREVEAGVFLYRLDAGAFRAQRKVVLLP